MPAIWIKLIWLLFYFAKFEALVGIFPAIKTFFPALLIYLFKWAEYKNIYFMRLTDIIRNSDENVC